MSATYALLLLSAVAIPLDQLKTPRLLERGPPTVEWVGPRFPIWTCSQLTQASFSLAYTVIDKNICKIKTDWAVIIPFETIHGPLATIGVNRRRRSCEFGQTSPFALESFPFLHSCEHRLGHVGAGASGPSREIRRRILLKSRCGMATSAI